MDFATLFLFCFISLVIGAVLMLIIQYYIYVRFCDMPSVTAEQKRFNEKYGLPEDIRENAAKFDPESKSPLMALNLLMQFLFHELKNTAHIRKWLYRKLSLELDELVQKNPTGKLFDKLTLKDLNLGDHFPEVKLLRVHDVNINQDEGRIENLDIIMQINYAGNFRMAVDADLVLGKKASLNLTVKRLVGMARLQFTRKPYTHWSLSFLGDPQMDLGIESKFQGRQMQSNISAIISNQIRRTVRRKHTLPKYKIRLKPFFYKIDEEMESADIAPNGYLEVKICELSRLNIANINITDVYCTLTVGPWPWVEVKQKDDFNILLTLDIEIHKAKNQQIGILFKQAVSSVEIEAILPNTPAIKSKLRAGDTLVSIEGLRTHSIQQVAKIIRSHSQSVVALRIERTIAGYIENDIITEDTEVIYEELGDSKSLSSQITVPSTEQFLKPVSVTSSPTSLRQRRHNSSSDSSISNTPTNSPKKAKLIAKAIKKTLTREGSEHHSTSADDISLRQAKIKTPDDISSQTVVPPSTPVESHIKKYQQHSTINYSMNCLISIDDLCRFVLDSRTRYLNLCVYGKGEGKNTLLGFLNIPIKNIIGECLETSLIEAVRTFHLLPPNKPDMKSHPLAGLKNFNQNLCFGDIVMTFAWDGNPNQIDTTKKSTKLKNIEKTECEPDKSEITPKTHNFIRTHFQRATQCDYCGKKIWLKDAVQCHDCAMICHKKCVIKCQNSTVCGPVDLSSMQSEISAFQPEFTFTEAPPLMNADEADEEAHFVEDQTVMPEISHRPSLTSLISQGLKRVNSANSLAIPGGSSPMGQNSRSLPPSPQHSPRKQSLVSQGVAPFLAVTRYLESIPIDLAQLTKEQIDSITEPIISIGRDEDVMTMAKEASKDLFNELSAANRVEKINELLTKLRLALDSETANHSKLLETNPNENSIIKSNSAAENNRLADTEGTDETESSSDTSLSREALARRAFDLGKSEERVQALSVIMLYLCTGLQHAQGVASQ